MFFFFVFQPTIERKPSKTLLLTFFGRFPATFTNSRKKFRTACLEVGERYNDLKKSSDSTTISELYVKNMERRVGPMIY